MEAQAKAKIKQEEEEKENSARVTPNLKFSAERSQMGIEFDICG